MTVLGLKIGFEFGFLVVTSLKPFLFLKDAFKLKKSYFKLKKYFFRSFEGLEGENY